MRTLSDAQIAKITGEDLSRIVGGLPVITLAYHLKERFTTNDLKELAKKLDEAIARKERG